MSDGVIHTAFIHDFSKFEENCEIDKRAIETLGSVLEGSERPMLVTSGLATTAQGRVGYRRRCSSPSDPRIRALSEATAEKLLTRGVRVSTVRLPQVHDTRKQGLVTYCNRGGSREGCVGVCRRRTQPLGGRARPRCCPP